MTRHPQLLQQIRAVVESEAPRLRDAWVFFADHVPQMHNWSGDGPAWTWPAQYPDEAWVVMEAGAASQDEALELAEKLHAACGR